MLSTHSAAPKQVLLRLPDDVADKLARAVAPRKRNQFLIALLRRELEREDAELVASAEYMNALEAEDPVLAREGQEWVEAQLTAVTDDFDADRFKREFSVAQAKLDADNGNDSVPA